MWHVSYGLGLFNLNGTNLLFGKYTQSLGFILCSQKEVRVMLFQDELSFYATAKYLKI